MKEYFLTIIISNFFNKKDNIEDIIVAVLDVLKNSSINGEILVVDDDSKDGTADCVRRLCEKHSELSFIVRSDDYSLLQSVAEGFVKAQSGIIQVIDADFSHSIELIPNFYHAIKDEGYDVVIGSRYAKGGQIQNLPFKRRIILLGATVLGRVLFPEVTDPSSGFFAIKKGVVHDVSQKSRGKILMEVLGKGCYNKFKEFSIIYTGSCEARRSIRFSAVLDYIKQYIGICFYAVKNPECIVFNEWKKIIKFGFVGISGIVVNTGLLYALTECAGIYYLASGVFAIEASIITNFILNDFWTFDGGFQSRITQKWKRFASYQVVSIFGVFINLVILYILTEYAGLWYILSNIVGVFVAFIWNFFVNRNFTWRRCIS